MESIGLRPDLQETDKWENAKNTVIQKMKEDQQKPSNRDKITPLLSLNRQRITGCDSSTLFPIPTIVYPFDQDLLELDPEE